MTLLTDEQKAELAELPKHGEREAAGPDGDCACGVCGEYDYHMAACRLAHWLRELGGEAERQRQVEDAHGYAVYVHQPSRLAAMFPTSSALEGMAVDFSPFDSDLIFKPKG